MLLVKFESNYADEFDVQGFKLYKSYNEYQEELADYLDVCLDDGQDISSHEDLPERVCVCVGTNSEIEFDDVHEFLNSFIHTEIDKAMYNFIESTFGYEYGLFPLR